MKLRFTVWVVFLLVLRASVSWGTTFFPVSIERQLKEADAIVQGHYKGQFYKKLKSGEVVTVTTIAISKAAGFDRGEIFNTQEIEVIHPGGVWQDVVYRVDGTPRFQADQEIVLFLKKRTHGYWVNNLALGKFSLIEQPEKRMSLLVSDVFPEKKDVGRIDYESFNKLVKSRYGKGLETLVAAANRVRVFNPTETSTPGKDGNAKDTGRTVASDANFHSGESTPKNSAHYWWPIIVLGLLGFVSLTQLKGRE